MNLRSSAIGAVAGAIVVAVLAAIDPATPWLQVGLRSAVTFALVAAAGMTLSAASYWLHTGHPSAASHGDDGSGQAPGPDLA